MTQTQKSQTTTITSDKNSILEDLLDKALYMARLNYFQDPKALQMVPTFILHIPGDPRPTLLPSPWRDNVEKEAYVTVAGMFAKHMKATAVALISETWQASYDDGVPTELRDLRPSQRPDRYEALIACATDGIVTSFRQWKLIREGPLESDPVKELVLESTEGEYEAYILKGMLPPLKPQ